MVASAVVQSTITDIDDLIELTEQQKEDRDRYRAVAGWLLFVGAGGMIIMVAMVIVRVLYYTEFLNARFVLFGVLVSIRSYIATDVCI